MPEEVSANLATDVLHSLTLECCSSVEGSSGEVAGSTEVLRGRMEEDFNQIPEEVNAGRKGGV